MDFWAIVHHSTWFLIVKIQYPAHSIYKLKYLYVKIYIGIGGVSIIIL